MEKQLYKYEVDGIAGFAGGLRGALAAIQMMNNEPIPTHQSEEEMVERYESMKAAIERAFDNLSGIEHIINNRNK